MRLSPPPAGPLVLALLGLAGCAVGPAYRAPEPEAPANWSRLDSTEGAVTTAAAPGDLSQWWRRFDDPLLSELIDEALRSSPDLRLAQARLREARARRAVAGAARFPAVDASASASHGQSTRATGSATDKVSAGFDASWELDVFGGVRRSVEASQADQEAVAADLQATRVSLAAELARDYVEVRSLQQRLGIARENLARQSETLQLTEWRARAGLVTEQDVEQARSAREQTRAQLPSLEASLAQAEHRIDVLLGKAPGTLQARLAAGGPLPEVPVQVAVGIPADALRQRPDLRAAERRVAAETARVGVAAAQRYPSFRLSGSIGLDALAGAAAGDGAGAAYSLLAGVAAPIFQAGRLRNQEEAQDAVRERSLIAYEQAVLAALQEVEDALVSLARNRERAEALARAAESARNAAALARQRYGAGVIDFQPVLDTERTVLSLEDSLAASRAEGLLALIRLYKAMGGGWSPQAQAAAAKESP